MTIICYNSLQIGGSALFSIYGSDPAQFGHQLKREQVLDLLQGDLLQLEVAAHGL